MTYSLDGNGPAELGLTPQVQEGRTVIRLSGELDCATAHHLPRFVGSLPPQDCRWVHLDLADLDFIDAAGLTALLRTSVVVRERAGRMTVGRPRPLARRLIELTALPVTIADDGPEPRAAEEQAGSTRRGRA